MNEVKVSVIKNLKNSSEIRKICKLKNKEWNYGIQSQIKWFKKTVTPKDVNIILKIKNRVVGYLLLRSRTFEHKKDKKIKGKYFFFDSYIVEKKYRGKGFGLKLMNTAKKLILQKDYFSILTSNKKHDLFYIKQGWKFTKKIRILDHLDKWPILIFNKKYNKVLDIYFHT